MSFKVMCIAKNGFVFLYIPTELVNVVDPSFGEICTVLEAKKVAGYDAYILKEYPHPGGYDARLFVLLSDISETDFIREYNKEKV